MSIQRLAAFTEFCKGQPRDQKIPHLTWEGCAVGDFGKSLDLIDEEGYLPLSFPLECFDLVDHQTINADSKYRKAYNIVGNAGSQGRVSTYGGLTDYLEKLA